MNINGRYMDEGDAARRLEEIRTAVSMVPFNHPLRALLDFLIGYIDALGMEVEDAGAQLRKYDALDQLEDTPNPDETIYLYRITALPGWCHIRAAKGGGGTYSMGHYAYVSPQPDDAILRDNAAWRNWVSEQVEDTKRWATMLAEAADKK
jgi:hypothetical protein